MNDIAVFKRFSLKSIFVATTSLAVALGAYKHLLICGQAFLWSVVGFWFGLIILALSDSIDERRIKERNSASRFLNFAGFVFFLPSALAVLSCLVANLVISLALGWNYLMN